MGFFSAPGPLEIMVILAVALIFLGPSRLPDAARSVGKGMREFRDSLSGFDDPYHRDELESDDPDDDDPDDEQALAQEAAPVGPEPTPEKDS
jgi:sec-independent protein translocase protein TatA